MRLTTSPPSRAECHEIWEPKPPGTLWATPGLLQDSFTFNFHYFIQEGFKNLEVSLKFIFFYSIEESVNNHKELYLLAQA
jgi:hypothetical protein